MKKEVKTINVIIYYPNKMFIDSLRDIYLSLDLDYELYATHKETEFRKKIEGAGHSIVFLPKDFDLSRKVGKRVNLCEKHSDAGLYIYQPAVSLLNSIYDYSEINTDNKIVNILIPTGFNQDLNLLSQSIEKLNESGLKSLVIDTNPCRFMYRANWDQLTKEILGGDILINQIPYIDKSKYYYLKPFNSFMDYYKNCDIYSKLLKALNNIEGINYIFFIHYLNDLSTLKKIEDNSKVNILLSYAGDDITSLNSLSDYISKSMCLIELVESKSEQKSKVKVTSSENIWSLSRPLYKEFELSILEEVIKC